MEPGQIAQGSTTQASAIEETSASLAQSTAMNAQSTTNAHSANSLMNQINQAARNGTESVHRMSTRIAEMKSAADEQAEIVKTIDSIAFQTNLLALNAAVEAARAGDAGRGFSVVAEEVRTLARRSAEAAKETSRLIASAQTQANQSVTASEEVRSIFEDITQQADKMLALSKELTLSSSEQNKGLAQISEAMCQIEEVTQANAGLSEEVAASGNDLATLAEDLRSQILGLQRSIEGTNQLFCMLKSSHREDVGDNDSDDLPLHGGSNDRPRPRFTEQISLN